MKYNIMLILLALVLWVASFLWLFYEGNQAPMELYKLVTKLLASLNIPHTGPDVAKISKFVTSILLFFNIAIWSVVLYMQTVFKFMQPAPAPEQPNAENGGSIIINQHFGNGNGAPAAAAGDK